MKENNNAKLLIPEEAMNLMFQINTVNSFTESEWNEWLANACKTLQTMKDELSGKEEYVYETGILGDLLNLLFNTNIKTTKNNLITDIEKELSLAYDGLEEYAETLEDTSICSDHIDNAIKMLEKIEQ